MADGVLCPLPRIAISSRRYLGNKSKLIPKFRALLQQVVPDLRSFADVFAGTGVVGATFNSPQVQVVSNDLLQCNSVPIECFLGDISVDEAELVERLTWLQGVSHQQGYVCEHFGGKYFEMEDAAHIDAIREEIALWQTRGELSPGMRVCLLTSLVYAADRVARTCGHYDAWRRTTEHPAPLRLALPERHPDANRGNRIYNADANHLVRHLQADVVYLDPPYNSRQYSDTYHTLENLITWHKPPVFGVAAKMDRTHLKSPYSLRRRAGDAMADLVENICANWILLSYNNMAQQGNDRSNARIQDDTLMQILLARGSVEVHCWSFAPFSAGLSTGPTNFQERLFVCRVERGPRPDGEGIDRRDRDA